MANKNFGFGGGGDDESPRQMMGMGPGGIPIIMMERGGGERRPQPRDKHAEYPPVRVQFAMRFLQWAKEVGAERPVVFPVAGVGEQQGADVKILKGQDLVADEMTTQEAAAKALTDYFSGKLVPNAWEKADLQLAPAASITCYCVNPETGDPSPNCPLCGGSGHMKVILDETKIQQIATQATGTKIDVDRANPNLPATTGTAGTGKRRAQQ